MPSFDIVAKSDLQEVDNALGSVMREVGSRYDFKGSSAKVERKENELTLHADDSMQHKALTDMLKAHCVKRSVDPRGLEFGKLETASGNKLRQIITIRQGVDQENAKKITKGVKETGLKVQASIRGDEVRITGKKRDDLQDAIAMVKGLNLELPLQFVNFRD